MQYWIVINNEQRGPLTREQMLIFPEFGPGTPVWREGLADWTTAGQLPEAAEIFGYVEERQADPDPVSPAYRGVTEMRREPERGEEYPEMPPTYLVWAILSTVCCCLVTGIVACVYASKVAPLYNRGDFAGSKAASEKAGWWVVISFVAGLIWTPFYTLYSLLTSV